MSDWKDKPWRPKDVYRMAHQSEIARYVTPPSLCLSSDQQAEIYHWSTDTSDHILGYDPGKGDVTVENIWFFEYGLQTMEVDNND